MLIICSFAHLDYAHLSVVPSSMCPSVSVSTSSSEEAAGRLRSKIQPRTESTKVLYHACDQMFCRQRSVFLQTLLPPYETNGGQQDGYAFIASVKALRTANQ